MTSDPEERSHRLVVDTARFRKDHKADTETLTISGTYPANEAERWQHRLHPARVFAVLERDAKATLDH